MENLEKNAQDYKENIPHGENPQGSLDDTEDLLHQLIKPEGGIYTSLGENFNNATFGRDSLIASRELLDWEPKVAHDVILELASLQGIKKRNISNEQDGRIMHEHRDFRTWDTSPVNKIAFKALSHMWGGNSEQMTTYFSLDSTPLFTILAADYAKEDPRILDEKVVRKDGNEVTIRQSLVNSAEWVSNHIAKSGLVEVGRHNPTSLIHQTWKDSPTGYIRDDGTMANVLKPIAYLEIQALAADSLSSAADIIEKDRPNQANSWRLASESIIEKTIDRFWIEDKHFFASAIDKDGNNNEKALQASQSDVGRILNSRFFENMPEEKQEKYITAITKNLFSENFLTDVGIRCRSLESANEMGVADYHGALVSWPIDSYLIAKGLRKQNMPRLAEQLESRILNAVNASNNHCEFFYVMPDGKVVLNTDEAKVYSQGADSLPVQRMPESNIAWTVAAIHKIETRNEQEHGEEPNLVSWKSELEDEILKQIKNIQALEKDGDFSYIEQPNVYLDVKKGNEISTKKVVKELGSLAIKNFLKIDS